MSDDADVRILHRRHDTRRQRCAFLFEAGVNGCNDEIELEEFSHGLGQKMEVAALRRDVCLAPVSGHREAVSACRKSHKRTLL
jgi:hypothetical protein